MANPVTPPDTAIRAHRSDSLGAIAPKKVAPKPPSAPRAGVRWEKTVPKGTNAPKPRLSDAKPIVPAQDLQEAEGKPAAAVVPAAAPAAAEVPAAAGGTIVSAQLTGEAKARVGSNNFNRSGPNPAPAKATPGVAVSQKVVGAVGIKDGGFSAEISGDATFTEHSNKPKDNTNTNYNAAATLQYAPDPGNDKGPIVGLRATATTNVKGTPANEGYGETVAPLLYGAEGYVKTPGFSVGPVAANVALSAGILRSPTDNPAWDRVPIKETLSGKVELSKGVELQASITNTTAFYTAPPKPPGAAAVKPHRVDEIGTANAAIAVNIPGGFIVAVGPDVTARASTIPGKGFVDGGASVSFSGTIGVDNKPKH